MKKFILIVAFCLFVQGNASSEPPVTPMPYTMKHYLSIGFKLFDVKHSKDKDFWYTLVRDETVLMCFVEVFQFANHKNYCYEIN